MIPLRSRAAEYGLTGGLLLLMQLAAWTLVFPGSAGLHLSKSVASFTVLINLEEASAIRPMLLSLFAAIPVLCIFLAGYLLEVTGSVAIVWEAYVFSRHLKLNRKWLVRGLKRYETYIGESPESLLGRFDRAFGLFKKEPKNGLLAIVFFWKKSTRKAFRDDNRRASDRLRLLSMHNRLQALLISSVVTSENAPRLDTLGEQLRFCRTSRAISVILFVVSVQIPITYAVKILSPGSIAVLDSSFERTMVVPFLVTPLLVALSIVFSMKAYSRFCTTLFALFLNTSQTFDPESPTLVGVESLRN